MWANWTRCSGRASAFAPASISTVGPRRVGITIAMPGRMTPGRRRTWSSEAASAAPVFPAETTAAASPSPTARTARTSDESGLPRTASAGFSSISIASVHGTSSSPCASRIAGPKRTGCDRVGRSLDGARDDLLGGVVAAEGVDRDASRHGVLARARAPGAA